jgi:hypothetical protein
LCGLGATTYPAHGRYGVPNPASSICTQASTPTDQNPMNTTTSVLVPELNLGVFRRWYQDGL